MRTVVVTFNNGHEVKKVFEDGEDPSLGFPDEYARMHHLCPVVSCFHGEYVRHLKPGESFTVTITEDD